MNDNENPLPNVGDIVADAPPHIKLVVPSSSQVTGRVAQVNAAARRICVKFDERSLALMREAGIIGDLGNSPYWTSWDNWRVLPESQ